MKGNVCQLSSVFQIEKVGTNGENCDTKFENSSW